MATKSEMQRTTPQVEFPPEVADYIKSKTETNGSGGRPHFLKTVDGNPQDVLLEILDRTWLRNKSIGSTAKKFRTNYLTIYRILQDLNPFQDVLVQYMEQAPRRKVFYNKELESSDYETVQAFIKRALDPLEPVRSYRRRIMTAQKVWTFLKYKDPSRWTRDDVASFLGTVSDGAKSNYLDGVRAVAPQIADKNDPNYISTEVVRKHLNIRKKDLFGVEVNIITKALEEIGLTYHAKVIKLHISIGAREGKGQKAGITGISWDNFHKGFTRLDDFESKAKGGITWENCPVDLFWKELPQELKKIWVNRGKPITDKVILGGYSELTKIYKEARKALARHFKEKIGKTWKVKVWKTQMHDAEALMKIFINILRQDDTLEEKEDSLKGLLLGHYEEQEVTMDPDLFKEITTLKPHDADKIHCNLLWEAGVPVEVVAGQYLGRGRGKGLMGRGWLNTNTITKHYLSLTERSQRFKDIRSGVTEYSKIFNGGH